MAGATTFTNTSFAEGRFRTAHMGTWTKPPSKEGKKCVVKEKKETYIWKSTDWDTAIKIQQKAAELADGFNRFSQCSRKITFAEAVVQVVTSQPDPNAHPKLNEYVIVEDYIPGTFEKWCNNYGFVSSNSKSVALAMPAFMHWSWVQSKGELMIADLQGVRLDDGYTLTDPVILSSSNEYGVTDMGVEGMAMFFMHHECNSFCQHLPRPTLADFEGKIPPETLLACKDLLQQSGDATSYDHELQFSVTVRIVVAQTFNKIATKCSIEITYTTTTTR